MSRLDALVALGDAIDPEARFGYLLELEAIVRLQNETLEVARRYVVKNRHGIRGFSKLLELLECKSPKSTGDSGESKAWKPRSDFTRHGSGD